MNKEKLAKYKKLLEEERAAVMKKIGKIEKAENQQYDPDTEIYEPEKETDETEEFSTDLSIESNFKKQLNEIDLALNRIKEGTYGICEKCGMEIPEKILNIVPESRFCEHCK